MLYHCYGGHCALSKLRVIYRMLHLLRYTWENNIWMDLGEKGWEGVDWIIWLKTGTSGRLLWTW